ncbi:family 78 glycoside hydrolase catalytic domain (plasmid) [Rathayibacter sp. VKM Ac-2803]|uniref:alpha-L-rhamnosidase n=1 Tax=Rathayibacter caricis DSM 15933 TaxID=1328867 RepID=A0A2T4UPB8_9MICO|nr:MULTISPECIES: alpha-L-rhamnosidase [Rathayibacter]MWV51550.1 family 78 glycoside hydrolase catalytic domain [Rathayibacter sp. VKM Ac-2803]PTL71368.1 alpha-L-rhamnosidase [Rathayibacter caricis DSM 15933]
MSIERGAESQALFIGAPESLGEAAPHVRNVFELVEAPASATLRVTALGLAEPWINGHRVGDEVLSPGWTSYRHRIIVSEHDVTDLLQSGENVLGAIVGRGWAVGRLGWDGASKFYADRPSVWLELTLTDTDGRVTSIASSDQFVVSTGAVVEDDLYDGEVYDARLHPTGWSEPGYDASDWVPAEVYPWDLSTLEDRTAEPIRRIEVLPALEVTTPAAGAHVIDFGQVISGWVRLRVTGPAGTELTLRHGELLTPGGELETVNLRTAKAIDRYILSGEGVEEWEPRFTFHGFRYAEITGWPGALEPADVDAVVVHSDMTRTAWFESSDPLLNKLHANSVWGMRDNFVGLPTDCPQRDERLGWTGDINAFGATAALLYDVRGVLSSWLADVAAEQEELGYVPWYVPQITGRKQAPTALWGDVVVSLPWALYQEYGDLALLEQNYTSGVKFVDSVEALLDVNGLWARGYQFGDWLDPDAPGDRPDLAKADRYLVASAYFVRVSGELAAIARLLGHDDDAERYGMLSERARQAFLHEYVAPSGRIVGESPTAYALAIRFGILDDTRKARAGERLATQVADAGFRIATGFAGTPHVLDALVETGQTEVAFRLLMQTESPSFLYPVTQGATTIWERWDAVRPDGTLHPSAMTSLNHYALGAVSDWMHRRIGGLSALEPGYTRVEIAPLVGGGLTSASVSQHTVNGAISVSWRLEGDLVSLDVSIPEGVTARVVPPLHPTGLVLEVGSGDHTWSYEREVFEMPEFDLDTPVGEIIVFPAAWDAAFEAILEHHPFLKAYWKQPLASSQEGQMSLRYMLSNIPGSGPVVEADVFRALQSARKEAQAAVAG